MHLLYSVIFAYQIEKRGHSLKWSITPLEAAINIVTITTVNAAKGILRSFLEENLTKAFDTNHNEDSFECLFHKISWWFGFPFNKQNAAYLVLSTSSWIFAWIRNAPEYIGILKLNHFCNTANRVEEWRQYHSEYSRRLLSVDGSSHRRLNASRWHVRFLRPENDVWVLFQRRNQCLANITCMWGSKGDSMGLIVYIFYSNDSGCSMACSFN